MDEFVKTRPSSEMCCAIVQCSSIESGSRRNFEVVEVASKLIKFSQQNSLTSVGETEVGGSCQGPVDHGVWMFFYWGGKETLTGKITRCGIVVYRLV